MSIATIIVVIVVIAIVLIAGYFIFNSVKRAFNIGVIIIIATLLLGTIIIIANDLTTLTSDNTLFILAEDDRVLAAFTNQDATLNYTEIQESYDTHFADQARRTLVLTPETLDPVESITIQNTTITQERALTLIRSNNARGELVNDYKTQQETDTTTARLIIREKYLTDEELKTALFRELRYEAGHKPILEGIEKETIKVYNAGKITILRYLPPVLVDYVARK